MVKYLLLLSLLLSCFLYTDQKKGELDAALFAGVYGFGSAAAECPGEGKVGSLLTVPLCRQTALMLLILKMLSIGTVCPAGASVHVWSLVLWLKQASWHCCNLESNKWFRLAESSGDTPIPPLHNKNTRQLSYLIAHLDPVPGSGTPVLPCLLP